MSASLPLGSGVHHPIQSDPHAEHEREDESLIAVIREQIRSAPWYMGSTLVHMILLLLMMLVPTVEDVKGRRNPIIIKTHIDQPEVETPPETPVPEKTPTEVIEDIKRDTESAVSFDKSAAANIETGVSVDTSPAVDFTAVPGPEPNSPDPFPEPGGKDEEKPNLGILTQRARQKGLNGPGNRGVIGDVKRSIVKMVPSTAGGNSRGLCLIWLLDQSASMKDDQEALAKQARDIQDLLSDGGKKTMHSGVVTYGQNWTVAQPLTRKSTQIVDAILNVETDPTGVENTNQAIIYTCERIMKKMKGYTKVIVLLSDESSSDQRRSYEARKVGEEQQLKLAGLSKKAPLIDLAAASLVRTKTRLFVIGKESPFQQTKVWEPFVDDDGRRWILSADRGSETPEIEVPIAHAVRADFHNRGRMQNNYVKSGYGVYDLAYLARVSKGAYFILDNSEAAKRRPLSPSERARFPFKMCWGVMEKYEPLVVARSDYKKSLFASGLQGKKLWQLNEYFRQEGKKIARRDRCAPTTQHYTQAKEALRRRSELIPRIIGAIGKARADDEQVRKANDLRQIANLDIYYCVLLADRIITEAWLDAYESYRGPLDQSKEKGWHHGLYLTAKGQEASPEEKALFDERMVELAQACNAVIRRHPNTPYALAARWLQQGPRRWGQPFTLAYRKGKHTPGTGTPPVRPNS
ncbi:MAG: VWA domain-containing protein [Planctomycetota bacterium]|jgi:hypothetical protein